MKLLTGKEAFDAAYEGKNVEWRRADNTDVGWSTFFDQSSWSIDELKSVNYRFRLAPRTIMIGDVACVTPETEAPEVGTKYFCLCTSGQSYFFTDLWADHDVESRWLKRGLVYLEKEHAIQAAKAMIKLLGGEA